MGPSMWGKRKGDGVGLRRADQGEAHEACHTGEKAGLMSHPRRDGVTRRGNRGINYRPRGVGGWVGFALIVVWWLVRAGVEMRLRLERLSPSARNLPPTAMICHILPLTVTPEGRNRRCGRRTFVAAKKAWQHRCLYRNSCYVNNIDGEVLVGGMLETGWWFEKRGSDPLKTCHRLPHPAGPGL